MREVTYANNQASSACMCVSLKVHELTFDPSTKSLAETVSKVQAVTSLWPEPLDFPS